MTHTEPSKEIADLNLAYMLLAQKLLREDKAGAMLRLGLSAQMADVLVGMSLAEILRIAASNFVLCAFRLDERTIVQSVMQGDRQAALQQAHISIVLAAQHQAARAA